VPQPESGCLDPPLHGGCCNWGGGLQGCGGKPGVGHHRDHVTGSGLCQRTSVLYRDSRRRPWQVYSWLKPPTSDTICRDLWRTSWFDASTFDEEGRSAGCSWDVLIRWSLESWINHRSGKLTVTMYRRLLQQREHPQLFRPLRLMIVMMLMMMTCEGTSLRPIYKVYKLLSLSSDLELTNSFIYFHLKYVILHLCIWKLIWFIQINTFGGVVGTGFSMAISRGLLHGSCNFDNDYRVSCGQKLSTIPQYIASLWLCYFKVSGSLEITSALFVV